MKFKLPFKDYVKALRPMSNLPVDMEVLVTPFGIGASDMGDKILLVGHILDEMSEEFQADTLIDCLDVARVAWSLGHDPAGQFLDDAPKLLWQVVRSYSVVSKRLS